MIIIKGTNMCWVDFLDQMEGGRARRVWRVGGGTPVVPKRSNIRARERVEKKREAFRSWERKYHPKVTK